MSNEIVRQITADLRPVRPIHSLAATIGLLSGGFAFAVAALLAVVGTAGIWFMNSAELFIMTLLIVVAALLFGSGIAKQMRPGSARVISDPLRLTVAFAAVVLAFTLLFPWHGIDDSAARGWHCLRSGLAMALPAGVLVALVIRMGAVLDPVISGATAGAMAGWFGLSVLQYSCNLQNGAHLLFWHGGVFATGTLAGALAGAVIRHADRQ